MLRDSLYFTTLKSLDYNVVMTFRFNDNNNNNNNNNNTLILCFLPFLGRHVVADFQFQLSSKLILLRLLVLISTQFLLHVGCATIPFVWEQLCSILLPRVIANCDAGARKSRGDLPAFFLLGGFALHNKTRPRHHYVSVHPHGGEKGNPINGGPKFLYHVKHSAKPDTNHSTNPTNPILLSTVFNTVQEFGTAVYRIARKKGRNL